MTELTRRNFVGGTALGMGALAAAGTTAYAAESGTQDAAADAEYDVVVLGAGFSGLVSAMSAADAGAKVLLAEKLADGPAGGNSRVCGQMFLNGEGDVEATKAYLTRLLGSRTVSEDILDAYAEGYAGMADLVAQYSGLDKADFVDVADLSPMLGKMSPEYPEYEGAETTTLWATHAGASDSYLFQSVRTHLEENYADKVEVWFESPAVALVQDRDTGAVTGVVVEHDGAEVTVAAKGGVILATGGFENDREATAAYLNLVGYACIGALDNTGDGLRLAQSVGAKLWHMTSYAGAFGLAGLSFMVGEDENASMIETLQQGEMNTGAVILVGAEGRRWVDESITPRHGKVDFGNGQWLNPNFPDGIYAIYDQQQMDAINAAETTLIPEDYAGTIVECADVAEAAETIGCDAEVLQKTLDDYNAAAEAGEDLAFRRDPQYMRALEGDKLFLLPLKPALLNTQGGPERDVNSQVLDLDGKPIEGLYAVGELGGVTSLMYAGGMNVGECFISGDKAGKQAAAAAK